MARASCDVENDSNSVIHVLSGQEVRGLPDYGKVAFPPYASLGLAHVLPDIPLSAVDLLSRLLTLNPSSRLSAREVCCDKL